jgi:DNA-directed RNA polymerase specialized sigma24 family protein
MRHHEPFTDHDTLSWMVRHVAMGRDITLGGHETDFNARFRGHSFLPCNERMYCDVEIGVTRRPVDHDRRRCTDHRPEGTQRQSAACLRRAACHIDCPRAFAQQAKEGTMRSAEVVDTANESTADTCEARVAQVEDIITRLAGQCRLNFMGFDYDDVKQELRIAAWQIAQRFDASNGAKWRTYCGAQLGWRIKDLMRSRGPQTRSGKMRAGVVFPQRTGDEIDEWTFAHDCNSDDSDDVDWQDLASRVASEGNPVRALWLHASGLTMAEVGQRLGLCESRVSQLLSSKANDMKAAKERLRYLMFKE